MEELKNMEKKEGKRNKPKPWDDDPDLDRCLERWKAEKKFDPAWYPSGLLEVSSFSRVYPKRREKHLLKCWPRIKSALKGSVHHRIKILEDVMAYDIINIRLFGGSIKGILSSHMLIMILQQTLCVKFIRTLSLQEEFLIRRIRFLGHKSSSLKGLETSTNCFIRMHGNTVAAMGSFRGLNRLRSIVETCFLCQMRPLDVLRKMMQLFRLLLHLIEFGVQFCFCNL
ncbi:hypothetical protein N665_0114s0021 [Sinapis alba]|nr:hypothetical protein N665_0114s0021 [Sinapis alba]